MKTEALAIGLMLLFLSFFMMLAGFLMIDKSYLEFSLVADCVLFVYLIAYTVKGEGIPNWNAIVSRAVTASLAIAASIGAMICYSYLTIIFANLPGF